MNFKAEYNGKDITGYVKDNKNLNEVAKEIENKYNLKISDCDCFFINK